MDTDLVAPATPTDVPVTQTDVTATEPAAEPSIAEHEAQYGAKREQPDEPVAEKPRHRAKSQQASAGDAPRIAELTKKWRDAERERDEWKAKASSRPEPATVPAPQPAATPSPVQATEKPSGKPTWSQFEEQIGSKYDTWGAAQDAFVDARDEWKDVQGHQATQRAEMERSHEATLNAYVDKARELVKTVPDLFTVINAPSAAADFAAAPQLLQAAIVTHDNGPEIAYYLATHPDVLVELSILTDGKAITQQSVALLQRRLSTYRSPAAPTASAPAVPQRTAPRPPNAVRTGSLKPADEPPPDDASVAEHERYYGRKKR